MAEETDGKAERKFREFPAILLFWALAGSALAGSLILNQSRLLYNLVMREHVAHYDVLASVDAVLSFDSRLTMLAGLVSSTGEKRYALEYDRLAEDLNSKIKAVARQAQDDGLEARLSAVNEANLKLVEMDRRAIKAGLAGKRAEALALVSSPGYISLKKEYAQGVGSLLEDFGRIHAGQTRNWRWHLVRAAAGAAVVSALALVLWAYFSLSLYRWLKAGGAARDAVERKDEEMRHFFDTVQEVFYRADWKGRITDITPSIFRYSGFTREELLGVPVSNLYVNPADRPRLLGELLAKGIVEDYEVQLRTKDRGPLDILVNARLLKGFGGVPTGVEGSLRDITVRKAAEKRLERLNRLYTLLSRVNEAIVRIKEPQKLFEQVCQIAVESGGVKFAWVGVPDGAGGIRPAALFGDGAAYLSELQISLDPSISAGRGPTAVAARELKVVINSDSARNPAMAPWRDRLLRYGFGSSAAFPIAGTGVVAFYAAEPGFFTDDEERLLTSLAEDITFAVNSIKGDISRRETEKQLEHTREQLRQSQKMEAVGRLAGGIAHDFNNMLTAILSYASFLKGGLTASDPRLGDVQEIISAAEKAAGLTRQLLAFSRRQVLRPRVMAINDTVRGAETMLRRLIGENIEFSLRLDPAAGRIKADPGQVEQVLMNLAVNARDAIKGHGRIIIETAKVTLAENTPGRHDVIPPGRYARLVISDDGAGMDQDTLAHMFEPFFTTKRQGKGTGLGLSTVYGVVKQSGGYVWVYSEPGKGTSFKIYFPESEEAGEAAPSEAPEVIAGGTERLLLVEDDPPIRSAMARMLKGAGYSVVEASNGEEALGLGGVSMKDFSLVITDMMMPKMGGAELAAAVKAAVPGMPVLYVSGYSEEMIMGGGGVGGAFIQKPASPEVLLKKVREMLDAREKK